MPKKISETELEIRVLSIKNRRIEKVLYMHSLEFTGTVKHKDYHSSDTAVFIITEQNKCFKISPEDELGLYHGYGISMKEIDMINKDEGDLSDQSDDPDWQRYFGKKIISVDLDWQRVIDNMRDSLVPFCGMGYIRKPNYPQTLILTLESGLKLFFSVLKITETGNGIPFTNHLSVFFNQESFESYYKPLRNLKY